MCCHIILYLLQRHIPLQLLGPFWTTPLPPCMQTWLTAGSISFLWGAGRGKQFIEIFLKWLKEETAEGCLEIGMGSIGA